MARNPREALRELTDKLDTDTTMSDEDVALIHDAAVARATAIVDDREWASKAHVHDVPHAPHVTNDRGREVVDASDVICHDCRRQLVSDAGTTPLLVCPTVHGRRPRGLDPTVPTGAVECGRVRAE